MMKAEFTSYTVTISRGPDEPRAYGHLNAAGEHRLFAWIKAFLNANGFDLIKKRAWKDGHLVDDLQPYLRSRKPSSKGPHVYIVSGFWAIEGANDRWNRDGFVVLNLHLDVWNRGQDTEQIIKDLCAEHTGLTWSGS